MSSSLSTSGYVLLSEENQVLVAEALAARDALRSKSAALAESLLAARPSTGGASGALEERCVVAHRLLQEMELELDGHAGAQCTELGRAREQLHAELQQSRRTVQAYRERQLLLKPASSAPGPDSLTPSDVIQKAEAVQQESLLSVKRMQQQVAATKEVGLETMANLSAQNERIENLSRSAAAMESQLAIAQLEVQQIAGRLCGDLPTLVLVVLIGLGCVVIAVWQLSTSGENRAEGGARPGLSRLEWPRSISSPLSETE